MKFEAKQSGIHAEITFNSVELNQLFVDVVLKLAQEAGFTGDSGSRFANYGQGVVADKFTFSNEDAAAKFCARVRALND